MTATSETAGAPAGPLVLGGEFPSPTREQWLAAVEGVLKGKPFDKVLVTPMPDGFSVQPLYTAGDLDTSGDPAGLPGVRPFVRGASAVGGVVHGWDVRQRVEVGADASEANARVLAELERGATSVLLAGAPADAATLDRVLAGVYLELAGVAFEPSAAAPAGAALIDLWAQRGTPLADRRGSLGAAPLDAWVASGGAAALELDAAVALARRCAEAPGVRAITVDATRVHDAGGSPAVELGTAVATGVAYLRALTDAGLSAGDASRAVEFRFAATADQFTTIAKLRAARRLWARVAEVAGVADEAAAMHQHAVTSRAMATRYDPWVNMLRTTVACFAAGVGGADAVTVLPYDVLGTAPTTQSADFGARVARNTQALLLDESNLARVLDPGGGSWYVEHLTDDLAQAAWAWFRQIEAAGGIVAAAEAGLVAERVAADAAARAKAVATRKQPITGVSEFPDIDEPTPPPLAAAPASPDAAGTRFAPLTARRDADGYEALRDAAAAAGSPTVFLANLGPVAVHTARATFAKNFFEAGGLRTLGNDGFDSPVAAAAAFRDSGAGLAVICSSDAVYAERAEAAARALHDAGATRVYLAGAPGDRRDAYTAAGVDEFIHLGCDVLDVLGRALDILGVTR